MNQNQLQQPLEGHAPDAPRVDGAGGAVAVQSLGRQQLHLMGMDVVLRRRCRCRCLPLLAREAGGAAAA